MSEKVNFEVIKVINLEYFRCILINIHNEQENVERKIALSFLYFLPCSPSPFLIFRSVFSFPFRGIFAYFKEFLGLLDYRLKKKSILKLLRRNGKERK